MREIASIISAALGPGFDAGRQSLVARSQVLMDRYPLYPGLG